MHDLGVVFENRTESRVRIWKKDGKKWLNFKSENFGEKVQHKHEDVRLTAQAAF